MREREERGEGGREMETGEERGREMKLTTLVNIVDIRVIWKIWE